jgi:hypothetical protein
MLTPNNFSQGSKIEENYVNFTKILYLFLGQSIVRDYDKKFILRPLLCA